MNRFPKCPKCAQRLDWEKDALPQEKWPMAEWPILKCKKCGAILEKDNRGIFFHLIGAALIFFVTQGILRAVVYLMSGSELIAGVIAWCVTGGIFLWYVLQPGRLAERGEYAKRG